MKISKTLIVVLLSGGVAASATAEHKSGVDTPSTQPQYQTQEHKTHQTTDANVMQKIRAVEKDMIDNDLTANNVIGEDVYGSDGEKIGKIHDLKFEGQKYSQLRQQFLQVKSNGSTWSSEDRTSADRTRRAADNVERTGDRVADSVERAGERTADAIDRSQSRSSDTLDRAANRSADRVEREADETAEHIDRTTDQAQRDLNRAADRSDDAWVSTSHMGPESAQLLAIVQTGGVLGIGADYFTVPFDQLRYDTAEERFSLGITQSQLEQLRTKPTSSLNPAIGPSATR